MPLDSGWQVPSVLQYGSAPFANKLRSGIPSVESAKPVRTVPGHWQAGIGQRRSERATSLTTGQHHSNFTSTPKSKVRLMN